MNTYAKLLLEEVEQKEFSKENWKEFNILDLSTDNQEKYINYAMEYYGIPIRIRRSEMYRRRFIVEFFDETYLDQGIKKLEQETGIKAEGNMFKFGENEFIFSYNFDKRERMNANGKFAHEDDTEDHWGRAINNMRRDIQFGHRLWDKIMNGDPAKIGPELY